MIMFFLYIIHWMQKMIDAKISAQSKDVNSLAPKYAAEEKPKSDNVLTITAERINAMRALVPMILNTLNGFSIPFTSITNARNARTTVAQPPA